MFVFSSILSGTLFAQCPNDNALVGGALTPPCPGTITYPCVLGGQYALINVVAGSSYTFSTCGATFDTEITIYNNAGASNLGYNDDDCGLQSTVNWVATYTGQLRILVDAFPCSTLLACSPLAITCTPPPPGDCNYILNMYDSFGDGWDGSTVGISINGGPFSTYTVTATTNSVIFGVNIGDIIVVQYTENSPFPGEITWNLQLAGGILASGGPNPATGVVYSAIVDCITPPPAQEDCLGAITVCSNITISNNTTNTGVIADIDISNSGCLDPVENQGTWYVFSPSASGDLGLSIGPQGPDDYDWAVWGPYPPGSSLSSICPPAGQPIRCAASSGPGTFNSTGAYATGMGHPSFSSPQFASTALNYGIPATTNICPLVPPQYCGWVPGIQVTAGQVYLLYVSNWTQTSIGFDMDWILENGASLDCTVLPVELLYFDANAVPKGVALEWSTATELNNERFEVQRSLDDVYFEQIGVVPGAGNSTVTMHYNYLDEDPYPGMNYYRFRQVDFNGESELSPVRAVHFRPEGNNILLVPNPGSGNLEVLGQGLAGTTFLLMDATGRLLLSSKLDLDQNRINTADIPPGLYVYRVFSTSGGILGSGTWMKD